jgi:aspartyl-tRNA(Asn)/glutamyl-tRNA(Gln) amidotransferase subunit C
VSVTLSDADLLRLAALARLELAAEEREALRSQLERIIEFARQVQQVETHGVPPTSQVLGVAPRLRDDEPVPSLARDTALQQAPDAAKSDGLFTTPRVLA